MTPAEMQAVFGRRVRREREQRGWTLREMAGRSSALSMATISRAENGREIQLGSALEMAAALGLPLAEILSEPECGNCDDSPPARFSCPECGRTGAS